MMVVGRAAVFVGADQPLEIRRYDVSAPAPGHAMLRLVCSGVCGTDVHIAEGRLALPPAFILGHEFVGTVTALGDGVTTDGLGSPLAEGDAVIACVALPCGDCFMCQHDETASCLNFGVSNVKDPQDPPHFHGGWADYLHQPAQTLVKVPEGVDVLAAGTFPCAGPTAIRAFAYAGGASEGELVVVQGTGPVGLAATAWAAKAGCRVACIGSGSMPRRMELARELGAAEVIDFRAVSEADRLARVRAIASEMGRGDGADVVVESTGSPDAVPEGLNLVRTRGRYLVPGQYSASGAVAIQPELITFKAIQIFGSAQYKLVDIAAYLDFLRRHQDIQATFVKCMTHRYPVDQANEAIAAVSRGEAVKAVFTPDGK